MLSMKTLRVAIVTVGSALLLGPGLAGAVKPMRLDGTGAAAPVPLTYATETLPTANGEGQYSVAFPENISGIISAENLDLLVKPRRRIGADEDVFIRLELSGVTIGSLAPALINTELADDGNISGDFQQDGAAVVSSGGQE